MHSNKLKADQFHEVIYGRMIKVIRLEKLLDIGTEVASMRRFLVIQEGEGLLESEAKIKQLNKDYDELWAELEATFRYAKTKQKSDAIIAAYSAIAPVSDKFMNLLHEKRMNEAKQVLVNEMRAKVEAWQAAITDMTDYQQELAGETEVQYYAIDRKANIQLWTLGTLCLLLGGFAAFLITRSLTTPLGQAVRVADAIAEGDFDEKIDTDYNDEIGNLLSTMHNMRGRVQDVISAQREMTRRHDEGQISFRMDEARFPGEYGQMVRASNALIHSHISVKMHLMEIMGEYAVGNLSRDIDTYPGEKAILTRTMTQVKQNLGAINAEIKRKSAKRSDQSLFDAKNVSKLNGEGQFENN